MKFSLLFEKSNDLIEFDVINNEDVIEYFVEKCEQENCNSFTDNAEISQSVSRLLNELHNSLSLTNSVLSPLCDIRFQENHNQLDYLDQKFMNKQHEQWVLSQKIEIDIDQLRFSPDVQSSKLGWQLHDLYPDEIRKIKLAEAMTKLGYIFPYEEVNLTVHRLENFFAHNIEFKSDKKWQVFDNPFQKTMVSNNDIVNFSFGYTYVGRQFFDKWQFFDTDLECVDHYNYETLEFAFQINLSRPQTISYSPEFIRWCQSKNVPMITRQIPVANAVDIEKNLKHYRTILYKNSLAGNRASIKFH